VKENLGYADLHMHTRASDGLSPVHKVLDYIARGHEARGKKRCALKLDVIAITDHDVLDASLWAYEHRQRYPFEIIPGVEVTTREGHVLGLWVTQPIPKRLSIAETAAAIHEQGGVAILAHPGEVLIAGATPYRHLKNPHLIVESGVDAVEVFNAGSLTPGSNVLAARICRPIADLVALTGSSDAHTLNAIGRGITRFPGRSAADVRRAILARQTIAEGDSWALIDYLKLSPTSIRGTLTGFLERGIHSSRRAWNSRRRSA
jgi:predicted metal-dependent phosphoesterase TrpH